MSLDKKMFSKKFLELSTQQQYRNLFEAMHFLCKKENWGDPFNYARSREIDMACELGHKIADTYSGADAIDEETGDEYEYKSTTDSKIKGTYTGISVQSSWKKQVEYLRNEKLCKYKYHFYARYEDGRIVEMWKISGQVVFELLVPKLKKKYHSSKIMKDPRLNAAITEKEIKLYGQQLI